MVYIITMTNGRQYRVTDYDKCYYGDEFVRFKKNGDVTDRFVIVNIEHIDAKSRSNAELIGRVNGNNAT